MIDKQVMSSERDDWCTPKWLYQRLYEIFKFILDVAADDKNHLACYYFTKENSALDKDWASSCRTTYKLAFCNPPYGFMTLKFLKKIKQEYDKGWDIVVLIAARTDTRAFRIIWENAWKVLFFYGRLKFELDGQTLDSAPFPSALAFFCHNNYDLSSLEDLGKIVTLKELNK